MVQFCFGPTCSASSQVGGASGGFQLEGAQGADLVVVLAVPLHECARGDLESTGDAFDAPALAAEFDEPGSSFGVVHNLFYEQSTKSTWTNAVQVKKNVSGAVGMNLASVAGWRTDPNSRFEFHSPQSVFIF